MTSVWLNVDPDDPVSILTRLYELIKARDFGWEFFGVLLAAANWVKSRFDKPDIGEDGRYGEASAVAIEILNELGEPVPMEGPLTDRLILMAVAAIVKRLIDNNDLPQWLIDLLLSLGE